NYWVDVVFTASTTPDTVAPTVTSTSPAAGANGVATGAKPQATFSEAVQSSTIGFSLKDPGNATVAGSMAYDANARVATFTPSASLAFDTTYTATVSGAKDTAGNAMAAPVTWSFTTAAAPVDTVAPTILSHSPSSGAGGVSRSTTIRVTFSEPMAPGTIVLSLKRGTTAVSGTLTYDAATRVATFDPTSNLNALATYTVRVSDATDLAGNVMSPVTWKFTTGLA
ncbi:MAG TPA: Ig-like domain-containing protein, partial [Acidimicrobiales bacterium]|nr:Ig-like domain-containing protein [Acidimicrobiales bacterium]